MSQANAVVEAGARLYRINPEHARDTVADEVTRFDSMNKARFEANSIVLDEIREEKTSLEEEKATELKEAGTTEQKAKAAYRSGKFSLGIANVLVIISSLLIYRSLAPSFYGQEFMAGLISFGGGLVISLCAELLLTFLGKALNKQQMNMFMIIVTLVLFSCALGAGVLFSKARALQFELNNYAQSESALNLDPAEPEGEELDVEKVKSRISKLNNQAMILIFLGLEWLSGMLMYFSFKKIRKYGPINTLSKKIKRLKAREAAIAKENAYLEKQTPENIRRNLMSGIARQENGGNKGLMVVSIVVLLGMLLFFVLWSEQAIGAERKPTTYLAALDLTGSTARDRLENEKAIINMIDGLGAGDTFQLLLITEATWASPEFVMDDEMPSRVGYFKEQIKRWKAKLIREFKAKIGKLPNSRPASSILDGMYLFGQLLSEQNAEKKVLVILSDLRSNSEELSVKEIIANPKKALIKVRDEGLIPDLKGVEVHVMGVSGSCMPVKQWRKLAGFWKSFFAASGCTLKRFSIERHSVN